MSLSDPLGSIGTMETASNDLTLDPRSPSFLKQQGFPKSEIDYAMLPTEFDNTDFDGSQLTDDTFSMMNHQFNDMKPDGDVLTNREMGLRSASQRDPNSSQNHNDAVNGVDGMAPSHGPLSHQQVGAFAGVPPGTMPTANMTRNGYGGHGVGEMAGQGLSNPQVVNPMSVNPQSIAPQFNRISPPSQSVNPGNGMPSAGPQRSPPLSSSHGPTSVMNNTMPAQSAGADHNSIHLSNNASKSTNLEYKPPFVVDLPMVRKTMEGVNRALGVDLGGIEVGESASMSKPNGDSNNDDDDTRDNSNAKAEVSHVRLISDACGYIVASVAHSVLDAAHESYLENRAQNMPHMPPKPPIRKKRGGILGFKELAMRANLSPWHFHRVFRFVTGVTPKAYGEALWEYLMIEAGFDSENEELTINRAVASYGAAGGSSVANNLTTPSSTSSSPRSPTLNSQSQHNGETSATSKHSTTNSSNSSTSSASPTSSASKIHSDGDQARKNPDKSAIERKENHGDTQHHRTSSSSSNGAKSQVTAGQGPSTLQPLSGPVVPGRVKKSSSRSRGARSRSRNRSTSQHQVLNGLSAEGANVNDVQQPLRRGRSFSRVSQRPSVITTDQALQGVFPITPNPNTGNMTPLTSSDMPTFSPQSMNPSMMGQSVFSQDDFIGETFHPSTELMNGSSVYPFDVPDMNNLTLYQSERAAAGFQGRLSPSSGSHHNFNASDGIFGSPHSHAPMPQANFTRHQHHYSMPSEDAFSFNNVPAVPNTLDAYKPDYYSNSSALPRRVTPSRFGPHDNLHMQDGASASHGHHQATRSEHMVHPDAQFVAVDSNMNEKKVNGELSNSSPAMNGYQHQHAHSFSAPNSVIGLKSGQQGSRPSSPSTTYNDMPSNAAQGLDLQGGTSQNSSQPISDGGPIDIFLPENSQWEMYNQQNDSSSKTDQLGDLPASFYMGFNDSPTFDGDESKSELNDMPSALLSEIDPPSMPNWNENGDATADNFSY